MSPHLPVESASPSYYPIDAKVLNALKAVAFTGTKVPPMPADMETYLFGLKDADGKMPRIKSNQVNLIASCINTENWPQFYGFINEKTPDNRFLFNDVQLCSLMFHCGRKDFNKDFYTFLKDQRSFDGSSPRMDGREIAVCLTSIFPDEMEAFKKLLRMPDAHQEDFRFSPDDAKILAHGFDIKDHPLFPTLLDAKNADGTYRFSANNIDKITTYERYYKLPFEKILNNKDVESFNQAETLNFLSYCRANEASDKVDLSFVAEETGIDSPLFKMPIADLKKLLIKGINPIKTFEQTALRPTETKIKDFRTTLKHMEESIKDFDVKEFSKVGLGSGYSLDAFCKDFKFQYDLLEPKEQRLIKEFYDNIEITELYQRDHRTYNKYMLSGFPIEKSAEALEDFIKEKKVEDPEIFRYIADKFGKLIHKFNNHNEFYNLLRQDCIRDLNKIIKTCPEFRTTINKQQMGIHAYTLDFHLLETLKQVVENPLYASLSEKDKEIVKFVALFHDIAKKDSILNPDHAQDSEPVVYTMAKRLGYDDRTVERICGLVKNHHWVERLEKKQLSLRDAAFEFRKSTDFKMAQIMADADLKASGNEDFYTAHHLKKDYYIPKIQKIIDTLHETGIFIPQTHIPKASALKIQPETLGKRGEVTTNTVVRLAPQTDLATLGFEKGTRADNFYAIIHAPSRSSESAIADIGYAAKEGFEGVFSCSLMKPDTFKLAASRPFAYVFDVDNDNIALAQNQNLGTGANKGLENFKTFLFKEDSCKADARDAFSKAFKDQTGLNDVDYVDLYHSLSSKRAITDIHPPRLREVVEKATHDAILSIKEKGINEVCAYAPKTKAVITAEDPATLPYEVRKYAQKKDLPIIQVLPQ